MKKEEIKFMIEEISKELILVRVEEHGMTLHDAFDVLYPSDTYARLIESKNGLYSQSTPYIYECLEHELLTGKMM